MKFDLYKHDDWMKSWDGGWSFLSCTHFSDEYTKEIIFGGKPFKSQSIIFSSKGRSSGWMRQSDRDSLGSFLSKQIKTYKDAKKISDRLKFQAKDFLAFIKKNENTVATKKLYDEFWRRHCVYSKAHINVKYVVDYLPSDLLMKLLSVLQEARLAAEPVLNRTEEFMEAFAKILGRKTKFSYKLVLCMSKKEIDQYFIKGLFPTKKVLDERNKQAAMISDKKSIFLFRGSQVNKVEKLVKQSKKLTILKGAIAYAGKAKGIVRIVNDPKKVKVFNKGDILVAGGTRPEFLPIMEKAVSFVTDAGGILSHAAITAREMKKPCIIGTQIATKVFKDGDMVEVDANKGIVKKISKF